MTVAADIRYYSSHPVRANGHIVDLSIFKLIERDGVVYTYSNFDNNDPDYNKRIGECNVLLTQLETLVKQAVRSRDGVTNLANYLVTAEARQGLSKKRYHQLLYDTITLMKEGVTN